MDWILLTIITIGAFAIGALVIWIVRGRDVQAALSKLAPLESELTGLREASKEVETSRTAITDLREKLAAANTKNEAAVQIERDLAAARETLNKLGNEKATLLANIESNEKTHHEQVVQLTRLREEVQGQFKLLAGDVLRTSSEDFVKRAEEIFKAQKELTAKEIDARSAKIEELVKPLGESLKAYDAAIKEIEKNRVEGFSSIATELRAVNARNEEVKTVTANLVNALRASPKTRGRWGEETLRRVMELSGMVEHCDFDTERHFRGWDDSLRPDVIISVSSGRVIVVDAKAPISAYLDAIAATGDEEREALLKRHAAQLRERLNNLSSKAYWERIEGSPDCVVMFVPGDNFVSAAFERDPDLFEDGIKNRVLICTPTTFIALAKAISYGWRQQRLAQNAAEVARLGKELYARLSTMGGHVVRLSNSLKSSVDTFNKFVGSLESSVMPQARRFQELGVEGTAEALPEAPEIDVVVRNPQPNRDLLITNMPEGDAGET